VVTHSRDALHPLDRFGASRDYTGVRTEGARALRREHVEFGDLAGVRPWPASVAAE